MRKFYLLIITFASFFYFNAIGQSLFTFSENKFSTATDIPYGIVTADFDGDGKPDVTVINRTNSQVSIYRNTSQKDKISFASKTVLGLAGNPTDIIAGDIDRDGKPDILIKTNQINFISIYRNTSSGGTLSFSSRIDLDAITFQNNDSYGSSLALGDIDGDSLPEIISANSSFQTFSVFKNFSTGGNISFGPKTDFTCDSYPQSIIINDFDSDGKKDVIVRSSGNFFSSFRNSSINAVIGFELPKTARINGNASITTLVSGDYDRDGKPDLAAASHGDPKLFTIFKNSSIPGSISFESNLEWPIELTPAFLNSGDFDNDGKNDIMIISKTYPATLSFFGNNGSPGNIGFARKKDFSINSSPVGTVVTDIDSDGMPDFVGFDQLTTSFFVFRNTSIEPSLLSYNPSFGTTGTVITLKGYNFTGVNSTLFGNIAADSFDIKNDSTIVAIVGAGASGHIKIINPNGADSLSGFIFGLPPVIDSITPSNADSSDRVVVYGKNLMRTSSVSFGNIPATSFFAQNDNILISFVGAGGSGDVKISTPFGSATKPGFKYGPTPVNEPKIIPSGANPVTGPVSIYVFVDSTIQSFQDRPYVQRHFDIMPDNNPATATATIILYFSQRDFNNYNAHPAHGLDLPKQPGDVGGIANLRIYQYHGFSAANIPGTYTGSVIEINPDDSKIIWDYMTNQWSVTFEVNGFSGFFLNSAGNFSLPPTFVSFSATFESRDTKLEWTTSIPLKAGYFEMERSIDGQNFDPIAKVPVVGSNNSVIHYTYLDQLENSNSYYYRIKMVDLNGQIIYSKINKPIQNNQQGLLKVYPNPAKKFVTINHPSSDENSKIKLVSMGGKVIISVKVDVNSSQTKLLLDKLAPGVYIIIWDSGKTSVIQSLLVD